jgi:DNA adenine methylase
MKTPFPYFGSKSRIAPEVWRRFGDPTHYIEPFAGALGILLERPRPGQNEYVGDICCLITNFFRAARYGDHRELTRLRDWPTSQIDLKARANWLKKQERRLYTHLTNDPEWYDLQCAAWYAWAQQARIGEESTSVALRLFRRRSESLASYFAALSERLKNVVIHYGDWMRLAKLAERNCRLADGAILLDPPYHHSTGRAKHLYAKDSPDVSDYVCRWALARSQTHPRLRIALCGYEGEHQMPTSWEELPWWSGMGKGRERIWFSPNCLKV